MARRPARVLFVCAGNICRSPIAEAAFRQIASTRPLLQDLDIGSAGTIALEGNPATPEARRAAADEFGLDLASHRASPVRSADADLYLAMDAFVLDELRGLRRHGRVELLGAYAGTDEIVGDPYGCAESVYRACARQLRRLLIAAADRLEHEIRSGGHPDLSTHP